MNRLAVLLAVMVFFALGSVQGQDKDTTMEKLTELLQPHLKRLEQGTLPIVKKLKSDEFIRQREVVSQVQVEGPNPSDYAEKPYIAKVHCTSLTQESKIFPSREKAEKATEWGTPGKRANEPPNRKVSGRRFTITFLYHDKKWELNLIECFRNKRVAVDKNTNEKQSRRLSNSFIDAWWNVLESKQ